VTEILKLMNSPGFRHLLEAAPTAKDKFTVTAWYASELYEATHVIPVCEPESACGIRQSYPFCNYSKLTVIAVLNNGHPLPFGCLSCYSP
jgi:hypothetical protein